MICVVRGLFATCTILSEMDGMALLNAAYIQKLNVLYQNIEFQKLKRSDV